MNYKLCLQMTSTAISMDSGVDTLGMESFVLFGEAVCFSPHFLIIYSVQPAAYIDKCFQH